MASASAVTLMMNQATSSACSCDLLRRLLAPKGLKRARRMVRQAAHPVRTGPAGHHHRSQ